ncbi:radical SAM protein [bacterium]|nr:radical SAM protein [candidate division CSSED10-310 bacterium]
MSVPNYLEFATRIFHKRNALPHYLVFFVTKNCTAHCKHCLLGDGQQSSNELTLEEIEMMTKHMDPLLFLLITGGDPFLRNDIAQIVQIFYKNPGFRNLGIPSNGFLTDRIVEQSERILRECPGIEFAVDISIDGIGADHDEIRQKPGLFEKAVATYRELEKLTKRYQNFNLNIAVTVSHYNHDKLDAIYNYLRNELDVKTINHLLCRGNPRDKEALDVDMENYRRFSDRLDEDLTRSVLKGYHGFFAADLVNAMKTIRQRLIRKIRDENRFIVPCYAAKLGVILYPDGSLAPCELRDEIIGNLRTNGYNFRALMESEEAHRIRNRIKEQRCYCTYECFLTNAVIFNPLLFSQVLLETARVKLSRLVSGGR